MEMSHIGSATQNLLHLRQKTCSARLLPEANTRAFVARFLTLACQLLIKECESLTKTNDDANNYFGDVDD